MTFFLLVRDFFRSRANFQLKRLTAKVDLMASTVQQALDAVNANTARITAVADAVAKLQAGQGLTGAEQAAVDAIVAAAGSQGTALDAITNPAPAVGSGS